MNILVCVKQVPDTTEIKINPATNTLIREGVPSIVNTFDAFALEMAARIKDENGAKIIAVSMGPEQARNALKECLSVGADKAYLVSDRAFGGSDTLATGYILSRALKAVEALEGPVDIVFCGKQAIDGDTAQTGPQLAEQLEYPQLTCVTKIDAAEGRVRAERETEYGKEIWESPTPVVVTVTKPAFEPRYPTIKSRMAATRAVIPVLTINEVGADAERSGLKGSPTKVKKIYVPVRDKKGILIKNEEARDSARQLTGLLGDAGLL